MKTAIGVWFIILTVVVASAANWQFVGRSTAGDCYIDSETLEYPRKKMFGFATDKSKIDGWLKCGNNNALPFNLHCKERQIYINYSLMNIPPDSFVEDLHKKLCP